MLLKHVAEQLGHVLCEGVRGNMVGLDNIVKGVRGENCEGVG